jgi:hypothetical protein
MDSPVPLECLGDENPSDVFLSADCSSLIILATQERTQISEAVVRDDG